MPCEALPMANHVPGRQRKTILIATGQLWRATLPTSDLRDEFIFLAVILDAYSRRVTDLQRRVRLVSRAISSVDRGQ